LTLGTRTQALLLSHPRKLLRDTAFFPPLMRLTAPGRKPKARALRHLVREELGLSIQEGEHTPVDDARGALYLYHKFRKVRAHGWNICWARAYCCRGLLLTWLRVKVAAKGK
jgi:hypothetical protein